MEKTIIVLLILALSAPGAVKAKTNGKKPTLSCDYDGKKITVKITGDLAPFKAETDLPAKDLMLCMVGERTAWDAKIAFTLKYCRKYSDDPKREYVFGPMTAFNRNNEQFALRFYANGAARLVNDTKRMSASGVCANHPTIDLFIISQARLLSRGQARSR